MIKLVENNKEKLFSNEVGLKKLQRDNPHKQFRISICDKTTPKDYVVQVKEGDEWLCLHD